jgi:sugar phosphate isomerase/epimerase
MPKNQPELMSLFWTTAGIVPSQGEISRFGFEERVVALAQAGFKGLGLWQADLEHILERLTLKEMKSILDDNGMKYLELEFLTGWFLDGEKKAESDRNKRLLFEASAALGAKHVKVGDFEHAVRPMGQIVEAFGKLCAEAESYGATIGFELMGVSMIDALTDAITMVENAGAKNGGLILDIYQVANLGMSFEEISRIPLRYLINVELNDGTLPSSPRHDPANRRFCGDGEYDIKGLIACVEKMGYKGPWAVEVISETLARLPLEELARRAYESTMGEFG